MVLDEAALEYRFGMQGLKATVRAVGELGVSLMVCTSFLGALYALYMIALGAAVFGCAGGCTPVRLLIPLLTGLAASLVYVGSWKADGRWARRRFGVAAVLLALASIGSWIGAV